MTRIHFDTRVENYLQKLEIMISNKKEISLMYRKFFVWLFRQTDYFLEDVSVNIPSESYALSHEELDNALKIMSEDEILVDHFSIMAPGYWLVGSMCKALGEPPVFAICLYRSLKDMKYLGVPKITEIKNTKLRLK